jgi:hypothetical protein
VTEASQFLFWKYINGIFVAVYTYMDREFSWSIKTHSFSLNYMSIYAGFFPVDKDEEKTRAKVCHPI